MNTNTNKKKVKMSFLSDVSEYLKFPDTLKLNLTQTEQEQSMYAKILWFFITPLFTCFLLICLGIYYSIQASIENDFEARKRLNEISFWLIFWGFFILALYLLLVFYQRSKGFSYIDKSIVTKLIEPTNATLKCY